MSQFQASGDHRLLLDLGTYIEEPVHVLARERRPLAGRALGVVSNDAFAAALVTARLAATHGATGLRLRSLYHLSDQPVTSAEERQTRREIDGWVERCSRERYLDAAGMQRRIDLERAVDWSAIVMGDGFAIRTWKPGRPGSAPMATCWRFVHPERVTNPDDRPSDDRLQDGIELDGDGHAVAIHVEQGNLGAFGIRSERKWVRVPIWAADGSRNVIHKRGLKVPGCARGVTCFASFLLMTRQVAGVLEAHVAGKRAQACHPIIVTTSDAEALKAAKSTRTLLGPGVAMGPLSVLVNDADNTVTMPELQYQGADLDAFLRAAWRVQAASWALPIEVVLCQMGEASLSSARAGLDQYERTGQAWQDEHEAEVSRPLDESLVREGVARDLIRVGTDDWTRIMAGRYLRPPRYSTDKLKDALTVAAEVKAGRSETNAFADRGWDFEEEVEQTKRDQEFKAAQGIAPNAAIQAPAQDRTSASATSQQPQEPAQPVAP